MLKFFEDRRLFSFIITLTIATIIFYISSLSFKGEFTGIFSIFYHFLAFFWFSLFLTITIISGRRKNLFALAIIIALIYAASDEIHQFFVPYRKASLSDVLINASGVLFSNLIYLLSFKKKKIKQL